MTYEEQYKKKKEIKEKLESILAEIYVTQNRAIITMIEDAVILVAHKLDKEMVELKAMGGF